MKTAAVKQTDRSWPDGRGSVTMWCRQGGAQAHCDKHIVTLATART